MAKPRKKTNLKVKPKIYVFCEGESTEPCYIRAYIDFKHPRSVHLRKVERPVIIQDTNKNTAVQIVKEAVDFLDEIEFEEDQVWAIYDRENANKYPDKLHKEAYDNAKKNGVNVVISNICFEYWLLLHLVDSTIAVNSCNELIGSRIFKEFLKQLNIKHYRKKKNSNKLLLDKLINHDCLKDAKNRAIKNNALAVKAASNNQDEPYKVQPYTDVYRLLEAIDNIAGKV